MTENTSRDERVERVAAAIKEDMGYPNKCYAVIELNGNDGSINRKLDDDEAARYFAAQAVAACDAEFERMLDEVHRLNDDGTVRWVHGIVLDQEWDGQFTASLYTDLDDDEVGAGTGKTRMAAIRDAVARAKGEQG